MRYITGDHQIRAAEVGVAALKVLHHAAHIVGPALIGVADDRIVERELIQLILIIGGEYADLAVIALGAGDDGLIIDSAGQHEAVVVIGMLADQVHSPRRWMVNAGA